MLIIPLLYWWDTLFFFYFLLYLYYGISGFNINLDLFSNQCLHFNRNATSDSR